MIDIVRFKWSHHRGLGKLAEMTMGISGQMALHAALGFSWPPAAWRLAAAFRSAEPAQRKRIAASRRPYTALSAAPTSDNGLTRTEAAALADAGLMPLADYLDLAARHGWSSRDA